MIVVSIARTVATGYKEFAMSHQRGKAMRQYNNELPRYWELARGDERQEAIVATLEACANEHILHPYMHISDCYYCPMKGKCQKLFDIANEKKGMSAEAYQNWGREFAKIRKEKASERQTDYL